MTRLARAVTTDAPFRAAVSAIDAGDVTTVGRLIAEHPALPCDRLEAPGSWLRDQVGGALGGFDLGIDLNQPSVDLYSHATPVHHAVCSGSLDAVRVLVEAGAALDTRDTAENATPYEWAEYFRSQTGDADPGRQYAAIAAYLRGKGGGT